MKKYFKAKASPHFQATAWKCVILTALILSIILLTTTNKCWSVPPVPFKKGTILHFHEQSSYSKYGNMSSYKNGLPDRVLALRVQFTDVEFDNIPDFPDSTAHDSTYFERYMFHLKTYFQDMSDDNFNLEYTVSQNVYTLSNTMAYYGNDDEYKKRTAEFCKDAIELADVDYNYNDYDAIIIFHAGAGQESDLNNDSPEQLWSTFFSKPDLYYGLVYEGDDEHFVEEYLNSGYEGLETDERNISEVIIMPETANQDNPEHDKTLIFSMMGMICHQYGHQLGLPTLFDNVKDNGRSQGIGNFGLMGTGVWNANGYVPPYLCAWSRCKLGWEHPKTYDTNIENIPLYAVHLTNYDDSLKLAKVPISDKEYFLLENRQQDPNGDSVFTFELVPDQPTYPDGSPKFDFYLNSYNDCEYDFFCPGFGGPEIGGKLVDGSGILIWHIDENIIDEHFTSDFLYNSVNGDASHKGVDLEEAAGIQYLDYPLTDFLNFGSPYDAYREGNYFNSESRPNSDSYYGKSNIDIHNISISDSVMYFSLSYIWYLQYGIYSGKNPFPIIIEDINDDGKKEMISVLPDACFYVIQHVIDDTFELLGSYLSSNTNIKYVPSFDSVNKIIVGVSNSGFYAFYATSYDNFSLKYLDIFDNPASQVIVVNPQICIEGTNDTINYITSRNSDNSGIIYLYGKIDKNNWQCSVVDSFVLSDSITCNLAYKDSLLYCATEDTIYKINICTKDVNELTQIENPKGMVLADVNNDNQDEINCVTINSDVYIFKNDGSLLENFPICLDTVAVSTPAVGDLDNNGFLDLIFTSANNVYVIDYTGEFLSISQQEISNPDTSQIFSEPTCLDFDNDGKLEICVAMSHSRIVMYDIDFNRNKPFPYESDFSIMPPFPLSFPRNIIATPTFADLDHNGYTEIYFNADDGYVYRYVSDNPFYEDNLIWPTQYGNVERTAAYTSPEPSEPNWGENIFVDGQVYLYPNPLCQLSGYEIHFNILVTKDANVSVKIFDIAGNLIKKVENIKCYKNVNNRTRLNLDIKDLTSGVYFVQLKARDEIKVLKLAIER